MNALLRNISTTSNNSTIKSNEEQHHSNLNGVDGTAGGPPVPQEAKCYIDDNERINFGKLITDEILAADYKLVQAARRAVN